MPGLMSKLSKLARSPQGKRAMSEAQRLAKDPKTRNKIDDVKRRVAERGRKPGGGSGRGPAV
jgi:hypothetical protein